ncbi:MAG: hypothetical protein EBU92_11710, partial [Betaproteobacteria bacterium]|nr:hypothetical protein [Betaproteobacteria bacterium]
MLAALSPDNDFPVGAFRFEGWMNVLAYYYGGNAFPIAGGDLVVYGCIGKEMLPNPALNEGLLRQCLAGKPLQECLQDKHPVLTATALWLLNERSPTFEELSAEELAKELITNPLEAHRRWHGKLRTRPDLFDLANAVEQAAAAITNLQQNKPLFSDPDDYIKWARRTYSERASLAQKIAGINEALKPMTDVFGRNLTGFRAVQASVKRKQLGQQIHENRAAAIADVGMALRGGDANARDKAIADAMQELENKYPEMSCVLLPESVLTVVGINGNENLALNGNWTLGSLVAAMPRGGVSDFVFDRLTVDALLSVTPSELPLCGKKPPNSCTAARLPVRGNAETMTLVLPVYDLCKDFPDLVQHFGAGLNAYPPLITARQLLNETLKELTKIQDPANCNRLMVMVYMGLAEWLASLSRQPEGQLRQLILNAVACAIMTAQAGTMPCIPSVAAFFGSTVVDEQPSGPLFAASLHRLMCDRKLGPAENPEKAMDDVTRRCLAMVLGGFRRLFAEWRKASVTLKGQLDALQKEEKPKSAYVPVAMKMEQDNIYRICTCCGTLQHSSHFPVNDNRRCGYARAKHLNKAFEQNADKLMELVHPLPMTETKTVIEFKQFAQRWAENPEKIRHKLRDLLPQWLMQWARQHAANDEVYKKVVKLLPIVQVVKNVTAAWQTPAAAAPAAAAAAPA